ncbi:eukaryotic translation initiation factor 3 subunit I-like [Pollicipes pollicipes]|uniref:eukaryotic translation initiation factor 3 subunit I-like n=1 Tax=Pollicipes pollicipes TaxID=41117 RepID=UPI001885604C|nr:eukaryotic translation initiation factor 3 subunit I-like [Pollicipes pollicipes]
MKPLMLHGHERSITQVKYNRDGDLLFSSSKDSTPNVWWSINGERLGTFDGHNGTVWCIDVNWDTTKFVSGAADNTIRLWDCETGKQLGSVECKSAVRTAAFSYSSNMICYSTDKAMRNPCEIFVADSRTVDGFNSAEPVMKIPVAVGPKVTSMLWGPLDEYIITGHDTGEVVQWELKTGMKMTMAHEHSGAINDMQLNQDGTMFITASKDHTSKLFDMATLEPLKTFKTERPVNSAAISPIRDHIVLGGGQDAMDVTTTSSRQGKFEARFYHLIFEEEFGRVKGHFGPINSLGFHPDGKSFVSGGEDGYIRVQEFDPTYFDFRFDY